MWSPARARRVGWSGCPMAKCRWPRLSSATSAGKAARRRLAAIPELLDEVLSGTINPDMVLDYETDLDHAADAYAAMPVRDHVGSTGRRRSLRPLGSRTG